MIVNCGQINVEMNKTQYHPESYWSKVAERIANRGGKNVIAGDDEPYYRYKRKRFLSMLDSIDFANKKVLEVGHGPGGNLDIISTKRPAALHGADISQNMIDIARKNLAGKEVTLTKVDGERLPFEDQYFDIVFTSTVLQHNTDERMMKQLLGEMCRVSGQSVVLFEKIDSKITGDDLCKGRPVAYYEEICREKGFELVDQEHINIYVSYLYAGAIRKLLNPSRREEGEPLNGFSIALQKVGLPITSVLDKVFPAEKDVAKLVFQRT